MCATLPCEPLSLSNCATVNFQVKPLIKEWNVTLYYALIQLPTKFHQVATPKFISCIRTLEGSPI